MIYKILLVIASIVLIILTEPAALIWLAGVTGVGYAMGMIISDSRKPPVDAGVEAEPEDTGEPGSESGDAGFESETVEMSSGYEPVGSGRPGEARLMLALSIGAMLLVLTLFKFSDVFLPKSLAIPLGMSYYTLMVIGYLIDVYRGDVEAERNPVFFVLYTAFFPQLTAGPIGRGKRLLKQYREKLYPTPEGVKTGLLMIALGVFQKWVLADNLSPVVDSMVGGKNTGFIVALGFMLYSFVIYFDFAGYSMIAIGAAGVFGVELDDNFHAPFFATSIKEFWRRWHISLSSWFRDYLYIPLGGSRRSKLRRDLSVLAVFVLSGIWHGNGGGFLLWGLMHGVFLVAGNRVRDLGKWLRKGSEPDDEDENNRPLILDILWTLGLVFRMLFVFALVSFAWVPFYAGTFEKTFDMFDRLFTPGDAEVFNAAAEAGFGMKWQLWIVVGGAFLFMLVISVLQEIFDFKWLKRMGRHGISIFIIALVCFIVFIMFGAYSSEYDASQFIYGGF